ncbi:MAG: TetR family transcriptional regulator, partial [Mycobacterium sp.]|uniref:TetR/AcrR family transcriptional regulator n=1 Tax=Mycobacterium sp. TaxID=1785 RepID=UPI001EBA84EB
MEERHCREKLIVATLDLSATRGYDSITVDQIAAAAGVSPNDFTRYFASKDAVIMSLLNDVLHATVAELGRVETDTEPIEALMIAT